MMPTKIPESQRTVPWVQSLILFTQEQAKVLREQTKALGEQAKTIQAQAEQISQLKITVQALRDEIIRLKKTPKRPKFRPPGKKSSEGSGNQNTHDRKAVDDNESSLVQKLKEEIIIKPLDVPDGSRFKGYTTYTVQELTLTPKDVTYKLEVWETPDGSVIRAILPPEVEGTHFGSELQAMIHGLYASGMTQPAIFQFIRSVGIEISEGQIHNILIGEAAGYEEQSKAILSTGLQEAPYIRVDDTGALHLHQNEYCTHIGGEYFAYYKTTVSKSRLNFLKLLAQGQEGYVINEAFL